MWRIVKESSFAKCTRYHCQQNIRSSNASPNIKNDEQPPNKSIVLARLHTDSLKESGTQRNKDDHRKREWQSFKHFYCPQDSGFYSHCMGWGTGAAAALGFQFCKRLLVTDNNPSSGNTIGRGRLKHLLSIFGVVPHTTKTLKLGVLSDQQPSTSILSSSPVTDDSETIFEEESPKREGITTEQCSDPTNDQLAMDANSVFSHFERVASECTAKSHNILGLTCTQQGQMEKAVHHFQQGSHLGNTKAQYNLAVCYEHGRGVACDHEKAIKFYKLALEGGHPMAAYNLAILHLSGTGGLPYSMKQSLHLLHAAADKGLDCAESLLGILYTEPGQRNLEKAVFYLQKAAEKNNTLSQFYLGVCYQNGWGVEKDWTKATNYYKRAADNGHKESQSIFKSISKSLKEIKKSEIYDNKKLGKKQPSDGVLGLRNDSDNFPLIESLSSSPLLLSQVPLLSALQNLPSSVHSEKRQLKNSASESELGSKIPPMYWSLQHNARANTLIM